MRSFLSCAVAPRIALATALVGLLPLLTGCGSQQSSEAATSPHSSSAETDRSPSNSAGFISATPTKSSEVKSTAAPKESPEPKTVSAETSANSDDKPTDKNDHRKQILGKWLQQNEEKRTITVNDDGTATIIAELNDYRQYIVGKTLEFSVEWTLEDGKLTFITTGGKPADSIKYITTLYGKSRVYRIIEFVEDRLVLKKDENGEDEPEWTRLAE